MDLVGRVHHEGAVARHRLAERLAGDQDEPRPAAAGGHARLVTAREHAKLASFERAFNERYSVGSTCDAALEPTPELSGGSCRAGPPR